MRFTPLVNAADLEPVWARLPGAPRPDRAGGRLEGLARTTILELGSLGLVEIASIRKPGAQRAIHLVNVQSLRNYLAGLAAKPSLPNCAFNNAKARDKRRAKQRTSKRPSSTPADTQ